MREKGVKKEREREREKERERVYITIKNRKILSIT